MTDEEILDDVAQMSAWTKWQGRAIAVRRSPEGVQLVRDDGFAIWITAFVQSVERNRQRWKDWQEWTDQGVTIT